MNNVKEAITKVVVSELNAKKSKKATGTKIATVTKILPIINITPFSS